MVPRAPMSRTVLPRLRTLRTAADLATAGLVPPDRVGALDAVAARYAVAVTPAKAALCLDHGAEVVLTSGEDIAARVREITGGKGVPVVYDSVGATTFEASLASLARRGLLVSFGNASGPAPAVEPLRLSRGGSLFVTRPTLFDYVATTEELDEAAAALFAVIASGAVKIEIGQRFDLADIAKAHSALAARETTGATVIKP